MEIYKSEIESGLSELIKNNTVAYCAQANLHKGSIEAAKVVISDVDVLEKVIAQNKDQMDLYYLESVLVSTGWNKNDDVFDAQETWRPEIPQKISNSISCIMKMISSVI